jgi:pSer/pThr/pTyr-binding forkhead associated (FHA) protein
MTADNRLVVEQGPSPGQEYPLSRLPVVIGRLPGVDILVEDTRISRQHARLSQREDQIQIEDLGSSNGTFVNGERIVAPHPLQDGDQIGLGQFYASAFTWCRASRRRSWVTRTWATGTWATRTKPCTGRQTGT